MRHHAQTLLCATLLVLLLPAVTRADVLRVPQDHPDIQAAIDASQDGDTVLIGAGTYEADLLIDGKNGLKLVGKKDHLIGQTGSPEVPAAARLLVVNSTDITLKRLHFSNAGPVAAVTVHGCTDVAIKRCDIAGSSGHGIEVRSSVDVQITKNTIHDSAGSGILLGDPLDPGLDTDGARLQKNKISGSGASGILVFGSDNALIRNKVTGGVKGISLTGSANDVLRNKISNTLEDGIIMVGSVHLIQKNRLSDIGGDGIDVEADACLVIANRLEDCGDDGLSIDDSFGSLFKKNRVLRAQDDGVRLASGGNTLIRNRAKDSAQLDLRSLVDEEDNTFINNVFPKSNID